VSKNKIFGCTCFSTLDVFDIIEFQERYIDIERTNSHKKNYFVEELKKGIDIKFTML